MSHVTPEALRDAARRELDAILKRDRAPTPKERLAIPCQEMPAQDPAVRRGNMQEVAVGYAPEQARVEALRCLQCKNAPCVEGCPVRINIPAFLKVAAEGDFQASIDVIKESSLLPAVCGRVCPQEVQCQEHCTVGKALKDVSKAVSIGSKSKLNAATLVAESVVPVTK